MSMCAGRAPRSIAASAIRGGERPAPLKSTQSAARSSATYTARPTIPCSAATVIGIVWEAEVAFSAFASLWRRYSVSNEPDP